MGILLLLVIIVLPIGLLTGFVRVEPMNGRRGSFILLALLLAIRPSLLEELIFRVLFIPHPAHGYPLRITALWAGVGLLVFILFHPINGLFIRRSARPLFTAPLFLTFAGLLGVACTAAYLMTGSIWPPTIIHWAVVTPWILFLGGGNALFTKGNPRWHQEDISVRQGRFANRPNKSLDCTSLSVGAGLPRPYSFAEYTSLLVGAIRELPLRLLDNLICLNNED